MVVGLLMLAGCGWATGLPSEPLKPSVLGVFSLVLMLVSLNFDSLTVIDESKKEQHVWVSQFSEFSVRRTL